MNFLPKYSKGTLSRLFAPSDEYLIQKKQKNLDQKLRDLETRVYDNPSKKWESLPGPSCNYNRCSNVQGCGSDCVCIPYGWYGYRCIPKCCIRADNSPPCHIQFPGQKIVCALPCGSYPGDCKQSAFNPYHQWQGALSYPKYPGFDI